MGFGASQAQSPGQEAKKRPDEKQLCLPVTIRAIELAIAENSDKGGELKFYGEEPSMLVLVAAVEVASKQEHSIELTLNDGSGRLKARYFITDAGDRTFLDGIVAGSYVNLYGNVRTAPMTHFAVTGMRPVQSADEVSYHTIEVAHTFLKMQKGRLEPVIPSPKKSAAVTSVAEQISPAKAFEAATPAPAPVTKTVLQGDQLKAAIMALFQKECESRGEQGFGIDELAKHFAPATVDQVKGALAQLVEEGEAFTTIDEEHYGCLV